MHQDASKRSIVGVYRHDCEHFVMLVSLVSVVGLVSIVSDVSLVGSAADLCRL